jgi:hypothetical protein
MKRRRPSVLFITLPYFGFICVYIITCLFLKIIMAEFKGCHPVVLFITELKSKSVQTQLNSIYYTEL